MAKPLAPLAALALRGLTLEQKRLCAAMFWASDCRLVRWAMDAILRWRPTPAGPRRFFTSTASATG